MFGQNQKASMRKEWDQFHPSGKATVRPMMVLNATGFPFSCSEPLKYSIYVKSERCLSVLVIGVWNVE